jgi:hypothetical protein
VTRRAPRLPELLLPLAVPLFTLALFLALLPHPRYALIYGDPDYAYLSTGMILLRGEVPFWADHPGTPVQEFAALVLLVRHWLAGHEASLETDFFLRSFEIHRTAVLAMLGFFLLAQAWCGRELRRLGFSWWLTSLLQLTPLLFFETFAYLRRLSPETPLAIASLLLVPTCWRAGATAAASGVAEKRVSPWTSLALGMLVALAASLKATGLPLALLVFFLPGWRARGIAAASFVFFYVNLTAVIWGKYPFMAEWYWNLLFHRGRYGQGATELFSWEALRANAALIAADFRFRGFLAWLPLVALLPFARGKGLPRLWPLLALTALYVFLTLKQPEARYLTPFIAVLGLLFLRARVLPAAAQAALLLAVVGASAYLNRGPLTWGRNWLASEALASQQLEERLDREPECHVSVIGPVPLRVFALMSGDRSTFEHELGRHFGKIYPRFTFMNQGFTNASGRIERAEWERVALGAPCLLLVGRENAGSTFEALFGRAPVKREVIGAYAIFGFPEELRPRPVSSPSRKLRTPPK